MPSVTNKPLMLNVIVLNVIMLSVAVLNVVAPFLGTTKSVIFFISLQKLSHEMAIHPVFHGNLKKGSAVFADFYI
jgi:hypothetical protein